MPWLFVWGVLVREGLSFWTGHPYDFETWVRLGPHVASGANPYAYLQPVADLTFAGYDITASIGYPPFWAFITAGLYLLSAAIDASNPFLYYFLLKQPPILGDIVLAFLLARLLVGFGRADQARWAVRFWLLHPLPILISAVWGMFDTLTMSLALLGLFLPMLPWRAFATGIGVFLKGVPVIYLPMLLLRERGSRWRFLALAAGIPAVLTFIPVWFVWGSSGFTAASLSQVSSYGDGFGVWYGLYLLSFLASFRPLDLALWRPFIGLLWIPAILIVSAVAWRRLRDLEEAGRWVGTATAATLAFLLVRLSTNEQHVIYLLSLLTLWVAVWSPSSKWMFTATWVMGLVYLAVNNTLLIRFASPSMSSAFLVDIALNNSAPIDIIRHLAKFGLGIIFASLLVQQLAGLVSRIEFRRFWFADLLRAAFAKQTLPYLAYGAFIAIGSPLIDFVITSMLGKTGAWESVLTEPAWLGLPLFSWYHISFLGVVLTFNALIALFAANGYSRGRTFATLLFVDAIAGAIAQPVYRLASGAVPLVGNTSFVIGSVAWGTLDERTFFALSVLIGIAGLVFLSRTFRSTVGPLIHERFSLGLVVFLSSALLLVFGLFAFVVPPVVALLVIISLTAVLLLGLRSARSLTLPPPPSKPPTRHPPMRTHRRAATEPERADEFTSRSDRENRPAVS